MSNRKRKQKYVPVQTTTLSSFFTSSAAPPPPPSPVAAVTSTPDAVIDLTSATHIHTQTLSHTAIAFQPSTLPVSQLTSVKTIQHAQQSPVKYHHQPVQPTLTHAHPPNTVPLVNKQTTLSFASAATKQSATTNDIQWYEHNKSLIYCTHAHSRPSPKIACFDMDNTLLRIKSNSKYPLHRHDWVVMYHGVKSRLAQLHRDGYKVVIFTNQWGIGLNKQNKFDITGKITDFIHWLSVPVTAFAATQDDEYRKGIGVGMWQFMLQYCNAPYNNVHSPVDYEHSFYVGDAAGRVKGWCNTAPFRHDRHCTDRKFAYDAGLQFHTPEEYFLHWPVAPFDWGTDIPADEIPVCMLTDEVLSRLRYADGVEMVILVGLQGSGKTTFAHQHYIPFGYVHCNQDLQISRQNVMKLATQALADGSSVVIDRTDSTMEQRKYFIDIAKQYNVYCKVVELQTPLGIARRLNAMRSVIGSEYQLDKPIVPDAAFYQFLKIYQRPDPVLEQFDEYITIPFSQAFRSEQEKNVFNSVRVR